MQGRQPAIRPPRCGSSLLVNHQLDGRARERRLFESPKAASVGSERSVWLRRCWGDLLVTARVERCLILASTFRSGSTYIAGIFAAHGYSGLGKERFNRAWKMLSDTAPFALSGDILRDAVSAVTHHCLSFKLMWPHRTQFARALGYGLDDSRRFAELFPAAQWIHVRRRDKFAQAISFWRAKQSGRWHVYAAEKEPPQEYDFFAILKCLRELELDDALWSEFFRAAGIVPCVLDYEDVLADSSAAMAPLWGQLGPPTHPLRTGVSLKRQSDELSVRLRSRFLDDLFRGKHTQRPQPPPRPEG